MEKHNYSSTDSSWKDQKSRMDDMIAKLKLEIKEVKNIDKDLTRQFILLGGKISQLKITQEQDDAFYNGQPESPSVAADEISNKGDISIDTKF